jgi:hypothetical protein
MLRTDTQGRFALAADDAVTKVIAVGESGYAEAAPAVLRGEPVLWLQPWGRVEGTWKVQGKAAAGRELLLGFQGFDPTSLSMDFTAFQVQTDARGGFVFPRVPPGRVQLNWIVRSPVARVTTTVHQLLELLEVLPGETLRIELGADAVGVRLRLRVGGDLALGNGLRIRGALLMTPPRRAQEAMGEPEAVRPRPQQPDNQEPLTGARFYVLTEEADGSWAAAGVTPGEYRVHAGLIRSGEAVNTTAAALAAEGSVIIPTGAGTDTVDLGEVLLLKTPGSP